MIIAALFGLLWGSFVGVLVDRIPSDIGGVLAGRSRCDACQRTLGPVDLVPVVSWLALRGKCRRCGERIGLRPLVTEVVTAVLFAATARLTDSPLVFLTLAPFLGVLLALSLIDLEHHRLPNTIIYTSYAAAVCMVLAGTWFDVGFDSMDGLLGSALFGGGLLLIWFLSRGGMGLGDVKLGALIGLVVGAVDLPSVGVAAVSAILFGGAVAVAALLRGASRRTAIPFGPMLAAGAVVALLAGPQIADWYVTLLR